MLTPIACMGLAAIIVILVRFVDLSAPVGSVSAEIPVMRVAMNDPAYHQFTPKSGTNLSESTPAIVLTSEAFYFGTVAAFSTEYGSVRNKIVLHHIDGRPQLKGLIKAISQLRASRKESLQSGGVVILVPSGDIPAPIVIQVMAELQKTQTFGRIVLGGGFI